MRPKMSAAMWIPLVWAFFIGSRPVSAWVGFDGAGDGASSYDAGNPLERQFHLVLIAASLIVLWRRQVSFGAVIRDNRWLFVLYSYWALSVLWSDAPFIAFKRWFKDLGNVFIVLVMLTEDDPVEAARTVFVRCAYMLVPLSLLFIRYIPELGRTYDAEGNVMFVGVCPSKNTLGSLLLVSILFFLWDLVNELQKKAGSRDRGSICLCILMLATMGWILHIADCATALSCTLVGAGILFGLKMPIVKRNLGLAEVYLIVGVSAFVALNSMFDLRGMFFHSLGRNETLTGRTDLWALLVSHQPNMLLGAGFNSFWSGESLREIWKTIPGVVQAHNGYLETYLNGGVIGVGFLLAWLWSASRKIKKSVMEDADFAGMRMMFLCIAVIYNWTEAAFNGAALIWLALLLAAIQPPGGYRAAAEIPIPGTEEEEETAVRFARSAQSPFGLEA